ncbi:MAG: dicarboxylate/amino acid:cation symporter [Henriciella sp.]|nr:dicarboxylate/amino acid:cation symporter [Henriciella sp.]
MSAWFKMDLWKRVMIGLVLGLAVGLGIRQGLDPEAARQAAGYFKPFGDAFMNLIRMLVVPLIFTTLVAGVLAMGDPKKLGSLGGRTIGIYMVTTLFAVTIGLIVGTIIQPGASYDLSNVSAEDVARTMERLEAGGGMEQRTVFEQITNTLLAIIPPNPVAAMVQGDVLAIIFFAILFGVGVMMAGEKGRPVAEFFESASEAVLKLTLLVMETAPFGVFALMAWVMADQGLQVVFAMGWMTLALYVACLIHIAITHGGLLKFIGNLPLLPFFRGATDAQAVAFSTSSSNATLPMTISVAETNLGIKKTVAGSVLPLGATINMDGTALYQGLIALFAAQALGIEISIGMYVTVALMATLVSIGTAGIPSVSLFLATTTLGVVGATPDQMALILTPLFAFDRLLDMMRTVTNITGDLAVASVVAKAEGEIDEEVFRARDNLSAHIDDREPAV